MEKLSNFVTKAVERRFAPKRRTAFTPCRASVCAAQAHRHRTAAPRRRAVPGMASRAVFSVRSPACLAEPGFARHLAEAPRRFCVRQRLFAARCTPALSAPQPRHPAGEILPGADLRRSAAPLLRPRRAAPAFSHHPLYTRISRRADHYIFPLPLTMRPELGIITYIVFYMIPSICAFVRAPDTVRLYPPRREVGRPHRRRADRRVYITWNRAGAAVRPGAGPAPAGRETGC